jgi:hypothetical protein
MTSPLASLYGDADTVATLYTAFLALDPVLSLDAAASLDAARCSASMPPPPLTPLLVLGLDANSMLVLDPVAAFLTLDPLLGLDAAFLALDANSVLVLDPVAAFLTLDPLLGLDAAFLTLYADPVPAFLALDSVPSLSRSLPFLGEFTNHLFLGLFVAWVLGPFC